KTSFQISGRDTQAVQTDVSEINTMFKDRYNNFVKLTAKEDFLKIQINTLNKEQKKLSKKLKHQEADLSQAEKADLWLAYAEGLKPNLPKIKTGQLHFTTVNYFDPDLQDICIPLLPEKSSLENMQIYMKKYHKAKKGLSVITENLKKTVGEIENTQQLIHRLQSGEIIDLNLGKQAEAKQIIQKASLSDKLMNLKIGEDWQIVIGRKAKENDFITTELARPHDWWFHSRIYHGAHVLLRCFKKQEATPELIKHCCNLAAWYSQAKFSQNVPVDYTQIRFVRKPRKSPAGYVIYSNHHTFYATPMDIRALRELLGL
ncbi:MAG: NFACT RNA binding domain-containing protein, partial [Candidatus Cloacimonetes bacterium]|nr:NFACT RNA binding domain-containing protein [Candidatus Cloacimonadota bacterium]